MSAENLGWMRSYRQALETAIRRQDDIKARRKFGVSYSRLQMIADIWGMVDVQEVQNDIAALRKAEPEWTDRLTSER